MSIEPVISRRRAWVMAARPRTLPAAVAPVLVGTAIAYADGVFRPLPALAALLGALLLQIGVNLANDYFDHLRGVDTPDRVGPTRVAASGLIPLPMLRGGMLVVFGLAVLVGLYLVIEGGWPIVVIGVSAILSALAYSGGPFPLASHGLGDLFVFLYFGLAAVCGTYYAQAHSLHPAVVLGAVPAGTLITAILVVNNYRDIETDRRAGKHTLAVMLGEVGTRAEFIILLFMAYCIPFVMWLAAGYSPWSLLTLGSLPLAFALTRTMFTQKGPALNRALASSAQLALVHSMLFALGLVLGR